MNTILSKQFFSDNVCQLVVEAPLIARSRKPGHFVIVRVDQHSERMPLTIADADMQKGTITLVVQRVGVSSAKLCNLNVGDSLQDLVGPLGKPTDIRYYGTVICAAGGVGAAPMLPIAKALKQAGNRVITVLAARNKQLIILEQQLREASSELIIMTDDGSYGQQGLVTQGIEQVINNEQVNFCITIGPAIMMKFVSLLTLKYQIPTQASLNTIMVDGTGMCGACRVSVDGKTRFVCVDGPEFDAHKVDFNEMLSRLTGYKQDEQQAYENYQNQTNEAHKNYQNHASAPSAAAPIPSAPSAAAPLLTKEGSGVVLTAENQDESQAETDNADRNAPWREQLRQALKPKQRVAIPRVKMPELDPMTRAHSLHDEVNQGLTPLMAQQEAQRCLDCANPTCRQGCPVNINIPAFVKNIERGHIIDAYHIIQQSSSLPAVCGRVCPQEKQCEAQCIHNKMASQPVAIGYLERYAADYALNHIDTTTAPTTNSQPAKGKIAVIGSGPAGLTFAGDMVKAGYEITVFEALHEIGGVLKYGIPEYRLPNTIVDAEIRGLEKQGVRFVKDTIIGKTITIDQLKQDGFIAFFVATGAGLPRFMNIPGENLIGVMSSNEYLTRVNLMGADNPLNDTPVLYGKQVAVIGGGNTAMDAVRTAKRLGAQRALIVYRRSENEMPARQEEVRHAKEEGVEFLTLHNPIRYIADDKGRVCQMELQVMTLGEPDESGRRSPVPVEGETKLIDVDMVIVAVGVSPNPILPQSMPQLTTTRKGTIEVNDDLQSAIPMIFAGGDIVRGGATVILAMADGRKAAAQLRQLLEEK